MQAGFRQNQPELITTTSKEKYAARPETRGFRIRSITGAALNPYTILTSTKKTRLAHNQLNAGINVVAWQQHQELLWSNTGWVMKQVDGRTNAKDNNDQISFWLIISCFKCTTNSEYCAETGEGHPKEVDLLIIKNTRRRYFLHPIYSIWKVSSRWRINSGEYKNSWTCIAVVNHSWSVPYEARYAQLAAITDGILFSTLIWNGWQGTKTLRNNGTGYKALICPVCFNRIIKAISRSAALTMPIVAKAFSYTWSTVFIISWKQDAIGNSSKLHTSS